VIYSLPQAIAALPRAAQRRYNDLVASLADAEALTRSVIERERQAEERLHAIEHRLKVGRRMQPVDGKLASLEAEHRELLAEHDRLNRLRSERNSLRGNVEQTLSQLNTAIMTAVGQDKPIYGTPVNTDAKPHEGETIGAAILRVRGEIMRVRAELIALKEAPLPADEVKAAIVAEVDRLANEGAPRLDLREGKVKVRWPDVQEFAAPNTAFSAPSGSASRLAAWLFRDQLVEKLTAGVDGLEGIPAAERPGLEKELRVALLQLELEEESLVEQAIAAGLEVHRRFDTLPFALLGLQPHDLQPPALQAAE